MHENVDISKDLQQTKTLFESLLLTQGGTTQGGSSGSADSTLYEIADDILCKVTRPDKLINCGMKTLGIILLVLICLHSVLFHTSKGALAFQFQGKCPYRATGHQEETEPSASNSTDASKAAWLRPFRSSDNQYRLTTCIYC